MENLGFMWFHVLTFVEEINLGSGYNEGNFRGKIEES